VGKRVTFNGLVARAGATLSAYFHLILRDREGVTKLSAMKRKAQPAHAKPKKCRRYVLAVTGEVVLRD